MKSFKHLFTRTRVIALIGAVSIVLLFGLNLLMTYLGLQHSLYIDTTYEELYTPTDLMYDSCDTALSTPDESGELPEVKAIFLADPDTLTASVTSRVTYMMLLKLQQRYSNLTVETINLDNNPTAVSMYKTTSMSSIRSTDMILTYGSKYRVLSLESFWTPKSDGTYFSYSGEYRFACALYSLLSVSRPTAYFITGHGETVYETDATKDTSGNAKTSAFYELLLDRGMQVKTLDLSSVNAIPDDCVLLILNDPKTDFTYDPAGLGSLGYVSDLEKIDRYLIERQGAMLVAKDYACSLPELEVYLREWGFLFSNIQVQDASHSVVNAQQTSTHIIAEYDTNTDSYGYSIYGEVASVSSAAATVIPNTGFLDTTFRNGGTRTEDGSSVVRTFSPFLTTYRTARSYAYDASGGGYSALYNSGAHTLVATGARIATDPYTAESAYSYVVCSASADFLSSEYLGRPSYANYEVLSLLVDNISRVDVYASMDLGGSSLNSANSYGKILITTDLRTDASEEIYASNGSLIKVVRPLTGAALGWSVVLIVAVPLAIGVVGVVVFVRRRYL